MKKHALILSLLSVSLASNNMEREKIISLTSPDKQASVTIETNGKQGSIVILHNKTHNMENQNSCTNTCPSIQLTTKVQEKISLEPKIVFSLSDEEVQKLRASLIQKDRIQSDKTALFNTLNNPQTTKTKKQSIIENLINLEHQNINLDEQLNIHLTPEDQQLLDSLDNEIRQLTLKTNMSGKQIPNINELITNTTSVIDRLIPLYRKAEAIQKFVEDVLMQSESGKLFILIKEKCRNHIDNLTQVINNLTMSINALTEASQRLPKK